LKFQKEVDIEAVVNKFTVENLFNGCYLDYLVEVCGSAVLLAVQNKILVETRS
jgi:hypothetical protein